MQQGLITRSTGSWYDLVNEDGHLYKGRLRGKNKLTNHKLTNPIAVGDYVLFELENVADQQWVVIHEIVPRNNYIARQSPHKNHQGHVIAANIDQAILLATLAMPRTSLGFIDRFLVTTEAFRIPTLVVFNKTDVLDEVGLAYQTELSATYTNIGYPCLQISAAEDSNFDGLWEQLRGKKTLLSGHSGVGKSTLLNRLAPDLRQRTSEISNFSNKGVHTTTFAEMFEIAANTCLIDTPGIKELGLTDIPPADIAHYFPEMRELLGQCRYHNCSHTNEPACAVKQAVEQEKIALSRYHSYLSMFNGIDNRR